jgi:pimeloyl-ACP methyl ester carboxylesterase
MTSPHDSAMLTRGYASTAGGQIHYWECGSGPALVLLAPAPRSARVYRRLLPLLVGFRALALDTRGFGESAPPDSHPAMSDYAEDVVRVLDSLAIGKAHLFGLHTGNKIAAAVAAGWPDRVGRVVLAGRTHSIVADQAARNAAVRASMVATSMHSGEAEPRARLLDRWALAFNEVSRIWSTSAVLDSTELGEDGLLLLRDEVIDEVASWDGVEPVYAANFAFDLAAALQQVKAPTLIIELETAETSVLGRQAPLLQARMSHCTVLAMDDHERTLLGKHPERLAAPLVEFLSGGDPSVAGA